MYRKYLPYEFDFKYEYRTYKKIGREEKRRYRAENCFLFKVWWNIIKRRNRHEKKYKIIKNYSEWKAYVSEKKSNYIGNEDFIHFLKSNARKSEYSQGIIGNIVTPVYVALVSGGLTLLLLLAQKSNLFIVASYAWGIFCILLILIFIFLLSRSFSKRNECYFYRDYIEIMREVGCEEKK